MAQHTPVRRSIPITQKPDWLRVRHQYHPNLIVVLQYLLRQAHPRGSKRTEADGRNRPHIGLAVYRNHFCNTEQSARQYVVEQKEATTQSPSPSNPETTRFARTAIHFTKNGGSGAPSLAAFSRMLPTSVKIYHAKTTGLSNME